jgi:hypothetical protein
VRRQLTPAIPVLDSDRLENLDEFARLRQLANADLVDRLDEGAGAAVHDGHFRFHDSNQGIYRIKELLSRSWIQKSQIYNLFRDRLYRLMESRVVENERAAVDRGSSSSAESAEERVYVELLRPFAEDLHASGVKLVFLTVNGQLEGFPEIAGEVRRLQEEGLLGFARLGEEIRQGRRRGVEITRGGGAAIVNFSMSEVDVQYVMALPWVATASDGRAYLPGGDRPHPRSYGTFSRKIGHYAIREKTLDLAQAVRSCTGLPADILKLPERGYLRLNYFADLVVFDPERIGDEATFDDPHQYSRGVKYVFVNGQPAVWNGTPTGALAGRALKREIKK